MISRLLKTTYHLAVYAIGIFVVIAAVSATAIRMLLPDIGTYRTEIEAWVSNYTDLPVAIRVINAEWQGWTPHLYLEDIDLLSSNAVTPIINFENAKISIDLLSSLVNRQIIPKQLIISGFKLAVIRQSDGSLDIEGIRVNNYQEQDSRNDELANWLFRQNLIELQNIDIEWLDKHHSQQPLLLSDTSLRMRSDGRRLQIDGSASLPAEYGESVNFAIDVTGNLLTSDWTAELYLHGNQINPDNWYKAYWPTAIIVTGGSATTSLWSSWENARLIGIEGSLEYDNFHMQFGEENGLEISRLDYRFAGEETIPGNWRVDMLIQEMLSEKGNWPATALTITVDTPQDSSATTYAIQFEHLKLDDIVPTLKELSVLPEQTRQLDLTGELSNGVIHINTTATLIENIGFDFSFDELTVYRDGEILPISEMSGRTAGSLADGIIAFDKSNARLNLNTVDPSALELDGVLAWAIEEDSLLLNTEKLQFTHPDIVSMLSGTLRFSEEPTFIDIVANASKINYENIVKYLPDTRRFRIKNWLQRSISGGELTSINAVLRGHVDNFPFDDNNGQFKIVAEVTGADLVYSANWPAINQIDASLVFAGRGLSISVNKGSIFDSQIGTAVANIPDLGTREKTVNIDGHITGNTSSLKQYIHQSPLRSHQVLNRTAEALSDTGQVDLGLVLAVPVNTPGVAPSRQIAVEGKLNLSDTTLATNIQDIKFEDVSGEIAFTRDSVNATDVAAIYHGHDVRLAINSTQSGIKSPVTVAISGTGDQAFIAEQINHYFPGRESVSESITRNIAGTTNWQASLTYTTNNQDDSPARILDITTDLYGMSVNIPPPFSKNKYTRTNVRISKNLDDPTQALLFQYGNIASTRLIFDTDEQRSLKNMGVKFGDIEDRPIDVDGITVYGIIDFLPLADWLQMMPENIGRRDRNELSISTDIKIRDFQYHGQRFIDTRVTAAKINAIWEVNLDGPSVKGGLSIPHQPDNDNPLMVNLDYLHLAKPTASTNEGKSISPADIPAITTRIDSFMYNEMDFGALDFTSIASENGLILNNILFTKPSLTVRANGQWTVADDSRNISDFSIQAHATEFNKMLEPFGYAGTGIAKGETHLSIDAHWQGSPVDFSLEKLNGALSMQIGQGQLLDIEPAAGRLFGLLSLQALPRRLLLDFSDLLGKGMAFDGINGSFLIENGNAHTEDLSMKGPSVDILITGRTGLSRQDYDQKAIVTPQISDSLAVASGFLGPLGIGLGTVLYLAGNMFEPLQDSINNLLKYEYTITGSWDDPVIEKYTVIQDNNG